MYTTIDMEDIQGYVIYGYQRLSFSRNVFLRIVDPAPARQWLRSIAGDLTMAVHHPSKNHQHKTALNLAFTHDGLKALGLADANLEMFSREFREGMTTPHRQRLLGDDEDASPDHWDWGGPGSEPIHMLLLLFAPSQDGLEAYYQKLRNELSTYGLKELLFLDGRRLDGNREHFGFADGMGQPIVAGSGRQGPPDDIIAAGEFVLGYPNEYGVLPDSPLIAAPQGDVHLLPGDANGSGLKDLGRNGSYLVFRQIREDVAAFWTFMNEQTLTADGRVDVGASTRLAAKMIGRWPSGAPLVLYPDADPGPPKGADSSSENDFGFAKLDKDGFRCPYGAHIRRVNPRDSFEDNGPKESVKLSKRHRIMRRGKLYGDPHCGSPTNLHTNGEVGLLFLCFNADIGRQFEFIQYTWSNYPRFKELYNDPDPIIGVQRKKGGPTQNFTIQEAPVSRSVTGLQPFTQVKGGAYFFLPSQTAVRYLATL